MSKPTPPTSEDESEHESSGSSFHPEEEDDDSQDDDYSGLCFRPLVAEGQESLYFKGRKRGRSRGRMSSPERPISRPRHRSRPPVRGVNPNPNPNPDTDPDGTDMPARQKGSDREPSPECIAVPAPRAFDANPNPEIDAPHTPASRDRHPKTPSRREGTRCPLRKTPKKNQRTRCRLCNRLYKDLKRHLTGHRHGLSLPNAKAMCRTQIPIRSSDGRYRRVCPDPTCEKIVIRMRQHLTKSRKHKNLTEAERNKLLRKAEVFSPEKIDIITPTKQSRNSQPVESPMNIDSSQPGTSRGVTITPRSIPHGPRQRQHDLNLSRLAKKFKTYLRSDSGGSQTEDFAQQDATRLQYFFNFFGSESLGLLVNSNFEKFVEHISKKFKPSTVQFYIRSLKRFIQYLSYNDLITHARTLRLSTTLGNMLSSYEKKKKQQQAETAVQIEADRLPAAARVSYLESDYVMRLVEGLMTPRPDPRDFVAFRDYLMTALTFLNGHRPSVLRNLTIQEFRNARIHVVEGSEPQADRTYMTILVAKHKTSRSHGAAIISVPMTLYRQMAGFFRMTNALFGLPNSAPFFTVSDGGPIDRSSAVNKMIKKSYKMSGTQHKYPQNFTITQTRKMLTSASRDMDPSQAALVAAQLCHSVAQADAVYRLQARQAGSTRAVHHLSQAVAASHAAEQETPRLAIDFLANIENNERQEEERERMRKQEGEREEIVRKCVGVSGRDKEREAEEVAQESIDEGEREECVNEGLCESRREDEREENEGEIDIMDEGERGEGGTESMGEKLESNVSMTELENVPGTSSERMSVFERARGSKRGRSLRESDSESGKESKRKVIRIASKVSVRIISEESSESLEYSADESSDGEELGYDPEEIESDWEEREEDVREWVNQSENPVFFTDMPHDREEVIDLLINLFRVMDYSSVEEEALYWVHHSSVGEMARTTSYFIAFRALSDELRDRFEIELKDVVGRPAIQGRGEHPLFGYAYQIVSAARLAVLLGINIDIRDVPCPTMPVAEHRPPKPAASPLAATTHNGAASTIPDTQHIKGKSKDRPRSDNKPSEPAANRPAITTRTDTLPKPSTVSDTPVNCPSVTALLRQFYSDAIAKSAAKDKKPTHGTVRQHLGEVQSQYPSLTELQIRDRLWTLSRQMQNAGKRKGGIKRKRHPAEIAEGLREIYQDHFNVSLNLNRHVSLAAVYERMDLVIERFGSILTAQQVRDKLWTMVKQARREAGLKD